MDIDNLLNKYFEGETTFDEESQLGAYFNQKDLPEHLKELAPIFNYLEDNRVALDVLKEITTAIPQSAKPLKRKLTLTHSFFISTVAAASIIALFFLFSPGHKDPGARESYAWINGIRITDTDEIKMFAEKSLENVSSNEDIFLEQMSAIFEENKGE